MQLKTVWWSNRPPEGACCDRSTHVTGGCWWHSAFRRSSRGAHRARALDTLLRACGKFKRTSVPTELEPEPVGYSQA